MKRIHIIPTLMCLAAIAASCAKETGTPEEELSGEIVTLEATIGTPVTKIHFEGDKGTYTATGWEADDCIWVRSDTQPYWEGGDCFKTSREAISSDGHSAKFTGRTRKEGRLAAVYPYLYVNGASTNDKLVLDIPATQEILPGDCAKYSNAAVAFWADATDKFSMKYLFGAVKFSLTGEDIVADHFELMDALSSNALWGSCTVLPNYESKDIASISFETAPSSNKLILRPQAAVTLSATPYEFYVMLPEGSLSNGFVIKAVDASGKTVASISSDKDNSIVRGKVVKMPEAKLSKPVEGEAFLEGSGFESDPYIIATAEDLISMSTLVNGENEKYAGKVFVQTADIDMNLKSFSPIGSASAAPFKGNYDGGNFKISNLAAEGLDSSNPASGLFGYAEDATIRNVKLENRSNSGSFNRVGGLVGYAKNCTIQGCSLSGGILGATANMCAAIVADMEGGTVEECKAENVEITNTKNYAAGIAAYAHGGATITSCTIENVKVSGANEIGGIAGKTDSSKITACSAVKSTVSASSEDAGAIVGWSVANSEISGCSVTESTVTVGSHYAGGIVGLVELSTLSGCEVTLSSIGGGERNGGIAGYMKNTATTIEACSVKGGSTVSGGLNIGGITGWMDLGTIRGCSFVSSKIDATGDGVGGIVGRAIAKNGGNNTIDLCWIEDSEIKGAYSVAGIVGYAYPDANGVLDIINSGVRSGIIHPTACDTGGDPAKGDSMCGSILGWMRLKDSGSKAHIYNCYSYISTGCFICDLAMSHPSFGGIVGYGSISSAGEAFIKNCVSSLVQNDIVLAGSVIADISSASQVGAIYGLLPNSANISVSDCHYIDNLSLGVAGANVVIGENFSYSADSFFSNSTMIEKLNTYVTAETSYPLKRWSLSGKYPLPTE
ncbi:MAG: hypothetical protein IJR77_00625 [Bacteroidales bacterium]|nr:hypothetical protein [Bacteroidales bacterium]